MYFRYKMRLCNLNQGSYLILKPRSPQASFYGSYLHGKIVPADHLLRRINQVVDPVSGTEQAFFSSMNS
jgi:hypothetical protein